MRISLLRPSFLCLLLLLLVSLVVPEAAQARSRVPVTTKYYSITLPEDWVVFKGPVKSRDNIQLQLTNSKRTAVATLVVGRVEAGDAKKVISLYGKRFGAPVIREGQAEFFLTNGKEKGYCIVREDARDRLLLILTVSGEIERANFLFSLRTPYAALLPKKPAYKGK
ncbi:MAG: hypothetical protein K5657_00960 [Desulfovibrio sp.]|nr:hypothetical protein [Desulfovibrio sp.]